MTALGRGPARAVPVVAILGGGFSGATLAWHLARALTSPARIVVIEPREGLGQGLAYSTTDAAHRINVPASRMTMDCADKAGLQRWIDARGITPDPEAEAGEGLLFPQRRIVGDYVADALAPLLASGAIEHWRTRALSVSRGDRFLVRGEDGATLAADLLVIAVSHPPPGIPRAFGGMAASPRLILGSGDGARLAELAASARNLLVVGTGLTSADVVASLDRLGYGGRFTLLSRRGLRSRDHAFGHPESTADFAADPATTALGVLRRVRRAVRRDAEQGLPWQAALDNARRDGPAIWAALPLSERRRLVERLRVWWDVHRFRIAPQVAQVLDRLIAQARLRVVAGRLAHAAEADAGVEVAWQPRGRQDHAAEVFDAVILTTGPAHDGILRSSPIMLSMAEAGLIRADALGLGLDVTGHCAAVGRDGRPVPGLLVTGPLARGHVGELMGIPEVTAHAEAVARAVLDRLPMAPLAQAGKAAV